VAYHVEIGRGHRTAREFNLDDDRLRRLVLEPWIQGHEVGMGDRRWLPAECRLTILEGPELSGPDLAFGRGWDRAERAGRNVTRELVAGAARAGSAVAVLAETESGRDAIMAALGELGLRGVDWPASGESALAGGRDADGGQAGQTPMAVILAVEGADPAGEWLYEAGVAVGALAGRALVARLGTGAAPPALAGLPTVGPGDELPRALATGLRRVGSIP
jgi:hypothetical protein